MEVEYSVKFKIVLVGDQGVGKSCLLTQFTDDYFPVDQRSTLGTDFKCRTVDMDGKWVKLQIWDTAGQERYRTIIKDYYRDAQGVIFVYDVTNEQSFDHIMDWIETVNEHAPDSIEQVIVGNKCDAEPRTRKVDSKRAQWVASQFGCHFLEASAKTNINVDDAFMFLARRIFDKNKLGDSTKNHERVKLTDSTEEKRKNCPCTIL